MSIVRIGRTLEMQLFSLDQLLPGDHRARSVWAFVKGLDLQPFYADLQVTAETAETAGRTAIAPEILIGLWLLATLDGIGAARELARRCETETCDSFECAAWPKSKWLRCGTRWPSTSCV